MIDVRDSGETIAGATFATNCSTDPSKTVIDNGRSAVGPKVTGPAYTGLLMPHNDGSGFTAPMLSVDGVGIWCTNRPLL